ncbi:uncharacterized protein HKW66_Vig0087290 [Vigna angularis]|uniref:Uncharacterized protein n=1 Tax=Phaseolus angularis TaxID=3914 RepID=A0A8T0KFX3_PHAAN|nr:uncharacterized protein HKW66_Vig0087290 [Vigna angularis]
MPADGVEDDAGTETEEEVEDNAGTETEEGVEDDVGTETEEEVEDDADTETEAEVGDDADTVTEAEVGDDAESPSSTCTGFSAMKIQRRFYLELYEDKGRIAQIFNTYLCLDDGRVVSNFVAQTNQSKSTKEHRHQRWVDIGISIVEPSDKMVVSGAQPPIDDLHRTNDNVDAAGRGGGGGERGGRGGDERGGRGRRRSGRLGRQGSGGRSGSG